IADPPDDLATCGVGSISGTRAIAHTSLRRYKRGTEALLKFLSSASVAIMMREALLARSRDATEGRMRLTLTESSRVERLRAAFEGREAIHIEKGVLLTRIRYGEHRQIEARIEEIPTPGLPGPARGGTGAAARTSARLWHE